MTPKPDWLTCCTPRYVAKRASGPAWCHADTCEAVRGRVSNVVLPPELEAASTHPSLQGPSGPRYIFHPGHEYLVGNVCDCAGCQGYRDHHSDDDVEAEA